MEPEGEIMIWSKKRSYNDPYSSDHHHDHHTTSLFDDSWEEQAFAEDAAGCLWPPRSYSCSFCRREFRSAQALGGHMNVHRRDRARLKQADLQNPDNRLLVPHKQPNHHSSCTLSFSPNPSSNDRSCHINLAAKSSAPSVRNSVLSRKENHMEKTLFSSLSNSTVFADRPKRPVVSNPAQHPLPPNLVPHDEHYGLISDPLIENSKQERSLESSRRAKLELNTDLSVSLNFLVHRSSDSPGKEDPTTGCKRRRIMSEELPSLPPFNSKSSAGTNNSQLELKNTVNRSDHDLDLELRLGDPPKVK